MLAMDFSELKRNIKENFDIVSENCETVIVTRENRKNIVIMSEEYYNNIMENIYLSGDTVNRMWLNESETQLKNGNVIHFGEWRCE